MYRLPFLRPAHPAAVALVSALALAACESGTSSAPVAIATFEAPMAAAAPAIVAESARPDSAAPPAGGRYAAPAPRRGVVTAGDIDDTLNLAAFRSYIGRASRAHRVPVADFGTPVLAQLVGPDGTPAPGLRYALYRQGDGDPIHQGNAGVDGMITVFPAILGKGHPSRVELRVLDQAGRTTVSELDTSGRRAVVTMAQAGGRAPDYLDLVLVLDTTGSMGDELAWLTRELTGIVAAARAAAPGVEIRYGLVVYRDHGDDYVLRSYPFTRRAGEMRAELAAQSAAGGGDYPEAAAAALNTAVDFPWRYSGRGERIVIHVADAPPHASEARAYLAAAASAAKQGVQIFGLGASGVAAESEALMRQAAAATSGRYLFLTDDSGVGLAHAEPTVACYRVTLLKDLLGRILRSELGGRRIEASQGEVLRQVGDYRGGVCQG